MGFYEQSKEERVQLVAEIQYQIGQAVRLVNTQDPFPYFSDEDTYIRKTAYLALGRIYSANPSLREQILRKLHGMLPSENELLRQTIVNAAGEIGMFQFEKVKSIFDKALHDAHHKVRNAVIGSIKKMSLKNPSPVLAWAGTYLEHPDKEIRREICHGIELRGRTHPEDILPLLEVLQHDDTARVRDTLVHVLGQISYKKGCLPKVISALNTWKNKGLVQLAIDEIVDVHSEQRYAKFAAMSQDEVIQYLFDKSN